MTITKRLFLAFGLLMTALIVTGASAILLLSRSQERFEYIQVNTIPSIADIGKTIAETSNLRALLYQYVVVTDESKRSDGETRINASLNKLGELVEYYNKNDITDAKDQQMNDQVKADIATIRASLADFLPKSRESVSGGAELLVDGKGIGGAVDKIVADLNTQINYNVEFGNGLRKENKAAYTTALWGMAIGILAVVLIIGAFAVQVVQGVRASLSGIQRTLSDVSKSLNLTRTVSVNRMDEVGQTATAFNSLLARVSGVLTTVIGSTVSVGTAAKEIAAGNVDLSARTEEQAASLEETASSMSQLTVTVKQNADNARHANTLATTATEIADAGHDAVQTMVGTMGQISTSSAKISEITALIEGIAFQTNILALNAAVEAARAGEQGRGFAVVATEVRTLAQRSSTAAKEIKDLIESSVGLVQDGSKQAADMGVTMGQVKQAIKQVSDIVGEIAAASHEQSRGIEQVNQAVHQMDEVTQQNAALVEQAAAAAQSLEEQAVTLKDAVSVFTVVANQAAGKQIASAQQKPRAVFPRAKPGTVASNTRSEPKAVAASKEPATAETADTAWEQF
ncbi:methyl-accepting chemotaxis protein [Caballeronia grimmiae]|uniref:Tar n=2 Tax=Caballeronia grimmiae TaxID=1071679 RepID=A0A069P5J5_9BURK|nr:methyl-accepting chemotaxis protein [Caballeronia grimmiae]KDR35727.1 Tar [Caballeronia grimmiae]